MRSYSVMAKRIFSVAFVIAILASSAQSKANIIYDLVDYSQFQNGYTISGKITTDGTIGDLIPANIIAWNYAIKSGATTVFSAASTNPNATTFMNTGAGLAYSTNSAIFVSALNGSGFIKLADGPTVGDMGYGMGQNGNLIVTSAGKNGGPIYWNNFTDQSVMTFATVAAVPEPSTYAMTLAGLACGGFSMWRRRKHQRVGRSFIIAASLPLVAAVVVTAGLIGGIAQEAVGASMVLVKDGSQILRFDGTTGASLGNVLVDYGGGFIGGYTFGPDRNIYVTDFNGLQINRFNGSTGAFMNTFATGTLSSPKQPLFGPDGNLYLGQSTGIITKYNGSTGQYLGIFGSPPVGASDFGGMTFRGNSLYVSYIGQSGSLYRYDAANGGNAQLVYGNFSSNGPRAPVFDNAGTMYVPDWQTNKIFKFSETTLALTGTITTAFGIVPKSLAFDESGALLVLSDNFSQSQINRYNAATGAFIDTLVAPGTGGMGRASDMLFIVPEPATYAMALAGLACGGYSMWRRRKRA